MQPEVSVARGAAALYVASIMTLALNTMYLVLLTNFVSLPEVGLVSLLNVLVVSVATISVLALPLSGSGVAATPPAVTRFISQYLTGDGSARRVYALSLGLCATISVTIAAFLSYHPVASLIAGPLESKPVFFAAIDSIAYSFAQLGGYSLLGAGRATSTGKLMVVSSVLRYLFASILLLGGYGPSGVFIGFALGDSVMAFVANASSFRVVEFAKRGAAGMRPVIAYMASVFVAALSGLAVSQTDKLLAFFSQGLGNLALYNVAAAGAALASFAPNAATNVLVPALSGYGTADKRRETLRSYTQYITLTAAPMGFGLAAVSPFLLRVFGDAYVPAAPLMTIISFSIAITAITSVYSSILLVEDRAHDFTISSVVALGGLVIVALLSVPELGLLGIALGRSAMLFIMLGLVAIFVRRLGMLVLDSRAFVKSIAASSLMAALIYLALSYSTQALALGRFATVAATFVMALVGLTVYLLVMKLMKAFTKADVDFIEMLLPDGLHWLAHLIRRLV
ncbi:MAG: polysaccharide biosynthesis C-terminal domain-containing protein [Nitrososphaerales archaeon]|nr:polysaccharide biosynthesis C-terminal domain-containing protein [Nitrososphaerales archaeon]